MARGDQSWGADIRGIEFIEERIGQWTKETGANVHKAVEVSAREVKDRSKEYLYFHMNGNREQSAIKHLPGQIQYEMLPIHKQVGSEAEIQPKQGGKQSTLGAIIEGGTPTSPPYPFMEPAFRREVKGFQAGIEKAMMEGWEKNG